MGIFAQYFGHHRILTKMRSACTSRESLERLLAYADKNVPFYEGRYEALLDKTTKLSDEEFWQVFAATPITTKQDLKNNNDAFMARGMAAKKDYLKDGTPPNFLGTLWSIFIRKNFKISISTGGTSGMPTYRWLDHDDANVMAQSFLESFHMNGWRRGESFVVYYPLRSYFTGAYAAFNDWLHRLFGFSVVPFESVTKESVHELLQTLKTRKATLLVIFPCVLQRVAEIMHTENIPPVESLENINVSGEFFFDCSKDFIQEMFPNARIEMTYGAVELGEVAHQHGASSFDYKVFDKFAYVEDGGDDSILVTSLHQKAFPMIRYKMEDKAVLHTDDDGAQYLLRLEGKNTDFLIGAEGKKYYASFFNQAINMLNAKCAGNIIHFMMRHEGCKAQLNFVLKNENEAHKLHIEQAARHIIQSTFPQFTDITVAFPAHFNHDYTRKFKIIGEGDGLSEVVGGYHQRKAG